ncbi:hypothetical protein [Ectopseudomonas mendocina]|nr:hypothetical protein [Pseudomonas mendocina]
MKDARADEVGKRIVQILRDEFGEKDSDLLIRKALGRVMADTCFHNRHDFSENFVSWSVDHAVSLRIEPIIERALALHAWLIEKNHDDQNVWDLGYADRYACFLANQEDFKAFAAQTQNFTWFVAMEKCKTFTDDYQLIPKWSFNLRMCVAGGWGSRNGWRRGLDDFNYLKTKDLAYGHDSLRYQDCRDAGYLISVKPELLAGAYSTEHSLLDWKKLGHVIYDLASLCDSVEGEE